MSAELTGAIVSDAERAELAAKLDADLDDFIGGLKKSRYKDGWKEETWEEEMQQHPFFRSKPFEEGEELPPLIQGLRDIKYDPETNTEEDLAGIYKEDGNTCFRAKKYRHAVDNYTEALRKRHCNLQLMTQLLTNRAAAHFHLGNYRSSRLDCERALDVTPDHTKALVRAAHCCLRLERHDEALAWCDRALWLLPNDAALVQLRVQIDKQRRTCDKRRRQMARQSRQADAATSRLVAALRSRGVRFQRSADGGVVSGEELLSAPDVLTPQLAGVEAGVHLSADGAALVWPLMLFYPEHSQMDLVQAADEQDSLVEHLDTMFCADQPPPDWDPTRRYRIGLLDVYYETSDDTPALVQVDTELPIARLLASTDYLVKCGVPGFIVLLRDSDFQKSFLSRYSNNR